MDIVGAREADILVFCGSRELLRLDRVGAPATLELDDRDSLTVGALICGVEVVGAM